MDNSSLSTSFDFNSQAGVMAVLAAVRQSQLTGAQKNELRDLVFLYANGGGDAGVKLALEQKLTAYQIKPLPVPVAKKSEPEPKAQPQPEVILPFGSSRPAPTFVAPTVVSAPVPKAVTPEVVTAPTPAPVSKATIPTVSQAAVPQPQPQPQSVEVKVVSTPVPTPAPKPVKEAGVEVPTPAQPQPQQQAQSAGSHFSDVNTNYLDRIREIKSAVNGKVGNPVNLVDIDNAVGREYMNALLDAMKRLSGGVGQIEPAMQRLEAAYKAVEVAVSEHQKGGVESSAVTPTPVAVPEPTPTPAPEVKPAPAPATLVDFQVRPVPIVPAPDVLPPTPALRPEPLPVDEVVKPNLDDVPLVREDDSRWSDLHSQNNAVAPTPAPAPAPAPAKLEVGIPAQPVVAEEVAFASAATSVPLTKQSGVRAANVHPVAEAVPPRTPEDLPTAAMLAGKDADPLYAKEIDDGLEQLLSDWVLFKKSGLFGTGPKGRQHPLFIKMAGLPIPLLLAGRFEGSTQDIKQSVTDYMNGWRYEQGIIYEQGETFEHYLRRVIKQILDLQKKHRNA